MKNSILFFYLLFLFCVIIATGCTGRNENRIPSITVETPFSFKTISIKDTVRFNILISNNGTENLIVDYLNIPCGCLADYSYDFYVLKSGITDSISFIYRPHKTGYIEENVFAYFKGYKKPIHLQINGRVTE